MVDTTAPKGSMPPSPHHKVETGAPTTEIEITPEMLQAGVDAFNETHASETWFWDAHWNAFYKAFSAMIAAAPSTSKVRLVCRVSHRCDL